MNYSVQSWVNYEGSDSWEFDNRKEAFEFYKAKIKNLAKERKEENQQAVVKFDDDDSWGYTLYNVTNGLEILSYFEKWKDVKNEK